MYNVTVNQLRFHTKTGDEEEHFIHAYKHGDRGEDFLPTHRQWMEGKVSYQHTKR